MNSCEVTVIAADGTERCVSVSKAHALEELQRIVDGFIEIIRLADDRVMVVNEDGTLLKLPVNARASEIFAASARGTAQRTVRAELLDHVVGTVVICPSELIE